MNRCKILLFLHVQAITRDFLWKRFLTIYVKTALEILFRGIRDISIPFEEDKQAITYIDKDTLQYILTTLVMNEDYDDNAKICSDIYKNKALYELFMDYNCFISRNISRHQFLTRLKIRKNLGEDDDFDERRKEHIAHLKDVSIITLSDFINNI